MSSDIAQKISHSQAIVETLSTDERQFLRGLVAGDSQATIAARLKLGDAEALAMKQLLMRKLGAEVAADAVRIGIYAGL